MHCNTSYISHKNHTIFTEIHSAQDPAGFRCNKNSPFKGPVWSTGDPPVEMRHIFCGEIKDFEAKGLHSLSSSTKWELCATVDQDNCIAFPNSCKWCKDVTIGGKEKPSGSALWPESLSPVNLVPMLQYLYNKCPPSVKNAALCFPNCHWRSYKEKANQLFDIVITTEGEAISSAYPAPTGHCKKHPHWQDCDSQFCQGTMY